MPRPAGGTIASYVGALRAKGDHGRMQRDAVVAFLVRVASAALVYVSQIVLARWMGAFEYGIFVVVWTWVLMLGGLATLGLSTLMIRLLPAYRETGELELLRGLLLGARLIGVAAGHDLMFALAMGFLARAAMGPSEFILNMLGEQKLCAAILATTAGINLALSVMLVPSLGLAGAALANAIAMTVGALSSMIAARRRLGLDIPIWRNLPRLSRQPG